ncbi:TRAP transporter large permease subunit [Xanthobacter sp. 91]|uniref:TRAP transporter large permease n=1 Tax=Xanthobacter sp. 91 TaxID=1117244 RepID=UPI00068E76C8|nr:TRAP transporter large permease subunit [Xanthobacter sp. 91]
MTENIASNAAAVPVPAHAIGALLDRGCCLLGRLCDAALVAALVLLGGCMATGVFSRYAMDAALPWTDEIASYLFAALTFLGAASGIWHDNHARIEMLLDRVGPTMRWRLGAIGLGGLLSIFFILLIYGWTAAQNSAALDMTSLPISQGWAYATIPLSAGLMIIFALRNFLVRRPRLLDLALVLLTCAVFYGLAYLTMDGPFVYLVLVVAMLAAMAIGVPIAFSLVFTSVLVLNSTGIPLDIVPQRIFDGTSSVVLVAIPMFMLTGAIMVWGGMAARLATFVTAIFGQMRGGLGIADVGASVIFADISGSAVADSAALGSIMIPQMTRRGYSLEFASALQAAAGSLGLMFPPSSTMIVYAWVTGISVGSLFLHSFLPGLLVAASFSLIIYVTAVRRGYPKEDWVGRRAFLASLWESLPALVIPVLILSTILGGITTPSESGVIAVMYTLIVSLFIYRSLRPRDVYKVLLEAALSASRVTLIIAAATLLSWVIAMFQGPQQISAIILEWSRNPYVVLILMNILMTVLHIMLEGISTILVVVPVFLPVMQQLHIDPIVFGIILAQNSALGLLFPPLGFNLYVISSISGVSVERVAIAILPFIAVLVFDILLLIFFPQIATLLPWLLS